MFHSYNYILFYSILNFRGCKVEQGLRRLTSLHNSRFQDCKEVIDVLKSSKHSFKSIKFTKLKFCIELSDLEPDIELDNNSNCDEYDSQSDGEYDNPKLIYDDLDLFINNNEYNSKSKMDKTSEKCRKIQQTRYSKEIKDVIRKGKKRRMKRC